MPISSIISRLCNTQYNGVYLTKNQKWRGQYKNETSGIHNSIFLTSLITLEEYDTSTLAAKWYDGMLFKDTEKPVCSCDCLDGVEWNEFPRICGRSLSLGAQESAVDQPKERKVCPSPLTS